MTRQIIIVDDVAPEPNAMLQALYSRSPKSVTEHLEQVKKNGAEKFMASYYVGYGHKSIGDCGTTSIFVENVSMLVAKAVQDWPLYSGQEASTRYLDMSKQEVLDPLGSAEGRAIQDEWMRFYVHALETLQPALKARFPIKEGEKETLYDKAIKARAFDIARGFLPAGATTYASWHTNLRQAHDHLKEMRHHPLEEVREVAKEIVKSLQAKYGSSFLHKEYAVEEEYLAKSESEFAYFDDLSIKDFSYEVRLDLDGLKKHGRLLTERPPKAELHHRFRQYGDIVFSFPLDFGSYRDLQRQRSSVQEMPLLTTRHGFHPWYLEQLTPELKREALEVLKAQESRIAALSASDEVKQYYTAMGYTVAVKMSCSLPSAVYIAELRSADTVHPTLRVEAQRMGDAIKAAVPGIAMHHDTSPGTWNIKRGAQDIVRKE
ncbi:MAG: FAD-dependent thymidylate synthase [Candidatus Taylorbacteria bacterium]|nr:FAD-dependent thymidylate synthase [Candidatus Taylorbacteria bacterium]